MLRLLEYRVTRIFTDLNREEIYPELDPRQLKKRLRGIYKKIREIEGEIYKTNFSIYLAKQLEGQRIKKFWYQRIIFGKIWGKKTPEELKEIRDSKIATIEAIAQL